MRKFTGLFLSIGLLLLSGVCGAQKMTWTSSSEPAKEFALNGADHYMNAEFERAYNDFFTALRLDSDFTVALVFMSNLTVGDTRKMYARKAVQSAANKTEGEKLFASSVDEKTTQDNRREIWAKLHAMFPDGIMLANIYVQTRATPDEQFAAGQDFIKKFPDQPSMYNTIAYYYMGVKKDNAMAKQYFEKYISMYPDGSNPYDSMGEFYMNTGDIVNAEKYYRIALEKYPFTTSSLNALQKIADGKKSTEKK
jgi:tetratricopeptide (TPR) repeat protein